MPNQNVNLNSSPQALKNNIKKLTEITEWFNEQTEVDIEEGLEKVKKAAELLKFCKARLKAIENEFEELKKDIEQEIKN